MTSLATSLQILAVNPLDYARQIKDLFLADDHPEFPEFFDRAYDSAVRGGGKSWIGLDAEGRVVAHVARFQRRFALGERAVVGGVLLNLMAAKSHRTFFPARALVRRVATDSKAERDVDFLYGTPGPAGSAMLTAAGFSAVDSLQRFAFPLAGGRWYTEAAARAYHAVVRIRAWTPAAQAVEHEAQHFDVGVFERPAAASAGLRPVRPPELYRQSLTAYPSGADHWFTFHRDARTSQPVAAVLVRGAPDRTATLYSLFREPSLPLPAIMPALFAALRRRGYRRLSLWILAGTHFARELSRAGFIARADRLPMLTFALTEAGADALRSIATWEITGLECDPYGR